MGFAIPLAGLPGFGEDFGRQALLVFLLHLAARNRQRRGLPLGRSRVPFDSAVRRLLLAMRAQTGEVSRQANRYYHLLLVPADLAFDSTAYMCSNGDANDCTSSAEN